MSIEKAFFISCAVSAASSQDGGAAYEKQLIYVGTFRKGDQVFEVDERLIDHWIAMSKQMGDRGFKIRLPVEHTFDPEKNRGEVVELFKKKDDKGRVSLFGKLKFVDEDAAALARTTDVSIYSPPYYQMGDGFVANRPITHVALTDYPVVPGLQPFETIAASLKGVMSMTMTELAAALELEVPEGADDTAIAEMILGEFAKLKKPASEPSDEETPPSDDSSEQEMSASMKSMVLSARKMQIDALVQARKITPAFAKELTKQYISANASLALSQQPFETLVTVLSKNDAYFDDKSKTPRQESKDTNPLMKAVAALK